MSDDFGILKILSLPIGNTQDITLRALAELGEASYVAAEDTREVGSYFAKMELPKPKWISYRDQNHDRVAPQIIELLQQGEDVILVSDRGTPTISDPGYKLVRDAHEVGIEVVSIPGPSAVIAALSISGLPTDRFSFLGFLPKGNGKQQKLIAEFGALPSTLIMYESPYRVAKLLANIAKALGSDTEVAVVKEITKLHEQVMRGTAADLAVELDGKKLKGEFVVLARVN